MTGVEESPAPDLRPLLDFFFAVSGIVAILQTIKKKKKVRGKRTSRNAPVKLVMLVYRVSNNMLFGSNHLTRLVADISRNFFLLSKDSVVRAISYLRISNRQEQKEVHDAHSLRYLCQR